MGGNCEVCGKDGASMTSIIEGVRLNVCTECAKLGKVVVEKTYVKAPAHARAPPRASSNEDVVDNYSEILMKKMSQSGMKYEDLARQMNEHESYVRRVIRGETIPTIAIAKKLERALGVKLIEEDKED